MRVLALAAAAAAPIYEPGSALLLEQNARAWDPSSVPADIDDPESHDAVTLDQSRDRINALFEENLAHPEHADQLAAVEKPDRFEVRGKLRTGLAVGTQPGDLDVRVTSDAATEAELRGDEVPTASLRRHGLPSSFAEGSGLTDDDIQKHWDKFKAEDRKVASHIQSLDLAVKQGEVSTGKVLAELHRKHDKYLQEVRDREEDQRSAARKAGVAHDPSSFVEAPGDARQKKEEVEFEAQFRKMDAQLKKDLSAMKPHKRTASLLQTAPKPFKATVEVSVLPAGDDALGALYTFPVPFPVAATASRRAAYDPKTGEFVFQLAK